MGEEGPLPRSGGPYRLLRDASHILPSGFSPLRASPGDPEAGVGAGLPGDGARGSGMKHAPMAPAAGRWGGGV